MKWSGVERKDANRIDGRGDLEAAARSLMIVGDGPAALQAHWLRGARGGADDEGDDAADAERHRRGEDDVVDGHVGRGPAPAADLDRHRHVVTRPRLAVAVRNA